MQKYIVIGETRIQAEQFIRQNKLNPTRVRINPDPHFLQGIREVTVFLLAGWNKRPEAKRLNEMILITHEDVNCIEIYDDHEIAGYETFHPRAMKLIRKKKPFLVVAHDEPYFMHVYGIIRTHEMMSGRWNGEDEKQYLDWVAKSRSKPFFCGIDWGKPEITENG